MITISLPGENHSTSLILTHFCETHGPSVVFTTQSEYILPSASSSSSNGNSISLGSSIGSSSSSRNSSDNSDNSSIISNLNLSSSFSVAAKQLGSASSSSSSPILANGDLQQLHQLQQQNVHNYTELPQLFEMIGSNSQSPGAAAITSSNGSSTSSVIDLNRPLISSNTLSILIPPNNPAISSSGSSAESAAPSSPSAAASPSSSAAIAAPRCPTCSSLPQFTGLVSQDQHNTNIYYISTNQPSNSSYSQIRTSCVRSLSCELVPGREGPVLINNNDVCFLSYTFKLNDSRARGTSRKYGFMVLGASSCLVSYFSWIVNCLKSIASEMQTRANVVFNREQSGQQSNQTAISNMMRRGIRAAPLRPLVDLMEDPRFFERLHRAFGNILSSCHLKYHLLQGQPPLIAEQEAQLAALKEEIAANESRRLVSHQLGGMSISSAQEMHIDMHARLAEKLKQTFPVSAELVTSLSQVSRIIGENSLSALIFNTIVGNQVIIQGKSPPLVASLIDLLKILVPAECCAACYYSDQFKEIWECNILGLSPSAIIPRHVDRDIIAMVDIDYYDKSKEPEDIDSPYRSTIEMSFNGPRFTSTLGQAIESIIKQNSPPEIERMNLLSLKEEWINKTKTFYSIRSIIVDDKDKKLTRFLQLINCNQEKDVTILMFWTTCVRRWYSTFVNS